MILMIRNITFELQWSKMFSPPNKRTPFFSWVVQYYQNIVFNFILNFVNIKCVGICILSCYTGISPRLSLSSQSQKKIADPCSKLLHRETVLKEKERHFCCFFAWISGFSFLTVKLVLPVWTWVNMFWLMQCPEETGVSCEMHAIWSAAACVKI